MGTRHLKPGVQTPPTSSRQRTASTIHPMPAQVPSTAATTSGRSASGQPDPKLAAMRGSLSAVTTASANATSSGTAASRACSRSAAPAGTTSVT